MHQELRLEVEKLRYNLACDIEVLEGKRNAPSPHGGGLSLGLRVIQRYELLISRIYVLRALDTQKSGVAQATEDFLAQVSYSLLSLRKPTQRASHYRVWVSKYRSIWREHAGLFFFSLFLFIGSTYIGWLIGMYQQEYVGLIIPQALMEKILDHQAWFAEIQSDPIGDGFMIAVNNILVCINCFLFGALLGIGGLVLLSYNGLMLGVVMGFCVANDFGEALIQFVVGHGFLELTVIIAAAFSSFILGRVFYMRPYRLFRRRFREAGAQAWIVLTGILPWLLVAGMIESCISPWPQIPIAIKLGLGIAIGSTFWVWSWLPPEPSTPGERE